MILEGAARFDARAAFAAQHRLAALRRRAGALLARVDFLFVPTTPTIYAIDEVQASPLRLNALLGTYVNFVNLLDLRRWRCRSGSATDGLPAGATLIAPWGRDAVAGVVRVGDSPVDVADDGRDRRAVAAAAGAGARRSRAKNGSRSPSSARTSRASR